MEDVESTFLTWGVSSKTLAGQIDCGDAYAIRKSKNGILVAVIDGLGHGDGAAEAARVAVNAIASVDSEDLFSLIRHCHQKLVRTRGVVMSLAFFNEKDSTMTWIGIGNVEGYLRRADADAKPSHESLVPRGGVVGYQLPPLRSSILSLQPGDTLVLATDGISGGFEGEICVSDSPQQIADRIVSKYAKKTDDALALLVRYRRARIA